MSIKNCYKHFTNKDCEYFPCHETDNPDDFNCLFCYCPLYALADKCGGNYSYLPNGIKDCSACTLPHSKNGYDYINSMYPKLAQIAKKDS